MDTCLKQLKFILSKDNDNNMRREAAWGITIVSIVVVILLLWPLGWIASVAQGSSCEGQSCKCLANNTYENCWGPGVVVVFLFIICVFLACCSYWFYKSGYALIRAKIVQSIKTLEEIQVVEDADDLTDPNEVVQEEGEEQALVPQKRSVVVHPYPRWVILKFMFDERNPDILIPVRFLRAIFIMVVIPACLISVLVGFAPPVVKVWSLIVCPLTDNTTNWCPRDCNTTYINYSKACIGNGMILGSFLLLAFIGLWSGSWLLWTSCCIKFKDAIKAPHDIDAIKATKKVQLNTL